MNLILLYPDDFSDSQTVRLTQRRLKHVLDVHKAKVGDTLQVGLLNGKTGTGDILSLNKSALIMKVSLTKRPVPKLPLTLVLALPRPLMLKRVLLNVAMMGVKKLILFNTWRVEKSFWQSSLLKDKAYEKDLLLGLEQAKDTVMPQVSFEPLFRPFVEKKVPGLIRGTKSFIADPSAAEACPSGLTKKTVLFIGPEGGFIDQEIEALKNLGVKPVSLGPRILRMETAVVALIAKTFL